MSLLFYFSQILDAFIFFDGFLNFFRISTRRYIFIYKSPWNDSAFWAAYIFDVMKIEDLGIHLFIYGIFSSSKLKIRQIFEKREKSQSPDLVEDCRLMGRETYSDWLFYDFPSV